MDRGYCTCCYQRNASCVCPTEEQLLAWEEEREREEAETRMCHAENAANDLELIASGELDLEDAEDLLAWRAMYEDEDEADEAAKREAEEAAAYGRRKDVERAFAL